MIKNLKMPFNDGILKIYSTDDEGNLGKLKYRLRFSEKIIGTKRHFAARAAGDEVAKLVSVPYLQNLTTLDIVEIEGVCFEILQIQPAKHNVPPDAKLSLRRARIL